MESPATLDAVVREALSVGDVESAVVFVVTLGSGSLELAAAAGIEGPALDGLVAAVRNPAHPVARTLSDDAPTFDVLPTNPGGPRLRSHLPLRVGGGEGAGTLGVLAVAHASPLDEAQRLRLIALAETATSAIG